MTDGTSDEKVGAAKAASTEQHVHGSASSLAIGLGLVLGGAVVLLLAVLLVTAASGAGFSLLVFIGGTAIVFGLVQLVIGVYQLADNVDRMAKAALNPQRD